jgi:hypothetical protein
MVPGSRVTGELSPHPMRGWLLGPLIAWLLAGSTGRLAAEDGESRLPYRSQPIAYFETTSNPVATLQRQIDDGLSELTVPITLPRLLEALQISESSQLLVFARNARQSHQISPANPRAIYFNDEVSVAWTPGGPNLEISAIDPARGPVFYLAPVDRSASTERANSDGETTAERQPWFRRSESCLACHVAEATRQVPGYLLRSMFTSPDGKPESGLPLVDHTTPYERRWGGWYVTGARLPTRHRGNLTTRASRQMFEATETAVVVGETELPAATRRHLQGTSDVVALLVHDHQTRFQTLLTRLRYESLLNRPLDTLPGFVRTLLLWDEPALPGPVVGRADYQAWFESAGPEAFRPLRQLDLKNRLLRHPLSWLVSTPQFQTLPVELRQAIHTEATRLVAAGRETPTRLPEDERRWLLDELLPRFVAPAEPDNR